ncbi:MAG: hypothetical protein ACR2O4_07570 [Hyphomicrobiaceae bacterium]
MRLRVAFVSIAVLGLAGCVSVQHSQGGSVFAFNHCASTGFFCGMHTFPYSTLLKAGHIYTTLRPSKNKPVFGAAVDEICERDTAAIHQKFPDELAARTIERESTVVKAIGADGDFSLDLVQLPSLSVGAGAKYLEKISYKFENVTSQRVSTEGVDTVKMNIGPKCKKIIAQYKKQGRYVFVAREVFVPGAAKITAHFHRSATGQVKANIVDGIAPNVGGHIGRNRKESRTATNRAVEVVPRGF